ncbi:hypothetical protein CDAR_481731 [Caerostris darwini]|uniref:Uncharacterized protein n=1 Tax=Caerostris darwini TaxID=1538125 RepID=A0AAV4UWF5_9ARAC|nr:hypothetical protein CDAR_481731 [Caerostris darwini]
MRPPFRGSALTPGPQCNSESASPTIGTYGFKQLINVLTFKIQEIFLNYRFIVVVPEINTGLSNRNFINPRQTRHAASPGGEGFPFGRTAALLSGEATLVSVPMATGSHVLPAIRRAGFSADAAKIRGSQCRDRDFDQTFGGRGGRRGRTGKIEGPSVKHHEG